MIKDAILDKTRKYRYMLKRHWNTDGKNFANFILLNPSTADEKNDDPTITACTNIAKNLDCDGLWVTNLFAFRATKPTDLKKATQPVGKMNNKYLKDYSKRAKITIVAWGNHGNYQGRDAEVIKLLKEIEDLQCLEITKLGMPKHPLYVKRNTKPFSFNTIRSTN